MPLITRILAFALIVTTSAASAGVREFVEATCYDCHDSATKKAGLDLEKLDLSLTDRKSNHTWELIHDLVQSGEMPPKKKTQPKPEERAAFLAELGNQLRNASLERQAKEGRGPVRRLTRSEYEATVNDLLHTHLGLRALFPDDAEKGGFDKVGEGLTLSADHFAAYQEVAEKALNMAIEHKGAVKWETDGAKQFKSREREFTNWGCWTEGNAIVIGSVLKYPSVTIITARAERSGRYRFTFTAQSRNNGGKSLPIATGVLDWPTMRPGAPETSYWFDIAEGPPRTMTMEFQLDAHQHLHLWGPTLHYSNVLIDLARAGKRWDGRVLLLGQMKLEGPLMPDGTLDEWPSRSYRELFDTLPMKSLSKITGVPAQKGKPDRVYPISAKPKEDAERLLRRFLPKAFRRPLPEEIASRYVATAHEALDAGVPFYRAMLDGYKSILSSPHFLILEEKPGLLDGPALASRLSYFLWNSGPDDELLAAATKGELATREGRAKQVDRMLKDARIQRFEHSFVDQWLDLDKLDATSPDGVLYKEITPAMIVAAEQETRMYFHEMLAENRSVLESIHSDWTYANELLCDLYDLPEMPGYEMRKVPLAPQSRRGGFLTQASILKVTADGAKTSPVIRGKWVNERILGITPRPPPEDVGKIEPDIRGATTIREQLDKHRNTPACMSCHTIIDPPGFALETFDVMGGWRDFYRVPTSTGKTLKLPRFGNRPVNRGPAVESGFTMPDGRAFADITEYKALLLEDKERIVSAFTEKLLTYATGALVQFADRDDIAAIVTETKVKNYGLHSLIHAIVQSRPFLNR
jgi:Protein of unknown function (DUF1592)/Protein of unknown function (DUF1588)/Protein of unknown function (DUF1585)/Protein of unknown function (DUF1587)/Protein of unknown function (DUF1595)/Planctomycete cytochrome C